MQIRLQRSIVNLLEEEWVEVTSEWVNAFILNTINDCRYKDKERQEKLLLEVDESVRWIYNMAEFICKSIEEKKTKAVWLSRWLTQKQIDYANSIINTIRCQYKEDEWWWILPDWSFTSKWYHLIDSSVTWELYEYIKKNI